MLPDPFFEASIVPESRRSCKIQALTPIGPYRPPKCLVIGKPVPKML